MKLLIFRRKNFRRIEFTLLILFIIISIISAVSCKDNFLDLDDDTHLSSWIESIDFTQKNIWEDNYTSNISTFETSIEFTIDLEIWNPGSFRILHQSGSGAYSFPFSITQSGNSTFILESYGILENDAGIMFCTSTKLTPGINYFHMKGGILNFNGSIPESNPYLPDGNHSFIFGNDQWIECYKYDINVRNGVLSHLPSEKPLLWGESPLNLGNPYWYIIGLPFIVLIIVEWRINVKEGLPKKQNE